MNQKSSLREVPQFVSAVLTANNVARNLEPVRGFHIFMRSLPEIMRLCPKAHILIVGGDNVSYASRAPDGKTWREVLIEQVKERIDPSRLHFLGILRYSDYLNVLKISAVHVYLTHPFVLSWSALEAMSSGCVVVGSDTAPVREVINSSNGFLVSFLDTMQLAWTVPNASNLGTNSRVFATKRDQM